MLFKIHYHYGKKFTYFHTNDLAANPVEILKIKHYLWTLGYGT